VGRTRAFIVVQYTFEGHRTRKVDANVPCTRHTTVRSCHSARHVSADHHKTLYTHTRVTRQLRMSALHTTASHTSRTISYQTSQRLALAIVSHACASAPSHVSTTHHQKTIQMYTRVRGRVVQYTCVRGTHTHSCPELSNFTYCVECSHAARQKKAT
jgi:hypothetical protein